MMRRRDIELWFILVYNVAAVGLYLFADLEPMFIVWAYFIQSLLIGAQFVVQNFIHKSRETGSILPLKQYGSTFFFVVHYGGFHLVYLLFMLIISVQKVTDIDVLSNMYRFIIAALLFAGIQLILFTTREASPNTSNARPMFFFTPYLRIVPMHLFIMVAMGHNEWFMDYFVFFMVLKLVFDLLMYLVTGGARREEVSDPYHDTPS